MQKTSIGELTFFLGGGQIELNSKESIQHQCKEIEIKSIHEMAQKRDFRLIKIGFQDDNLICNGHLVDLISRPLMTTLFRLFVDQQKIFLSKDTLVKGIYGQFASNASERLISSTEQKVNKLVSRARQLAENTMNLPEYKWIEWFVHDRAQKGYCLFQLTQRYLTDCQIYRKSA